MNEQFNNLPRINEQFNDLPRMNEPWMDKILHTDLPLLSISHASVKAR